MPTGILDGQNELSTTARRRLQLFRNTTNFDNATAAKEAITGQTLLDGEVIIARYNGDKNVQQGVLAIKGIGDNNYVYFDSAALADALQTVSGGTGISATTKENNNQVILLNISGETQEGKIVINDKTSGENVVEITGLTAANVTYDKGTGDSADKVITGATTTSAAIKELDAALDAANNANLTGATVSAEESKATVTFKNSNNATLSEFSLESNDNNLTVSADGTTGITLGIKSVGADKTDGTGEETGDTTGDVLTQKSYVDNEIAKAKKTAAVKMAADKSGATGAQTIAFTKNGSETNAEKYYVNMTVGEGDDAKVYNIELDAKDFVKDGVIYNGQVVYIPSTGVRDLTVATDATALPEGASLTKTTTATQAAILLRVKNAVDPDATQTYSTITIKTSDLLGDLVGGDGIIFDGSNIKIDLADQTNNSLVKLSLDGTTEGSKMLNVNVTTGETAFNKDAKKWSVAGGKDGLTTATEVVKVANKLQSQIDDLSSQTITGSSAISADTQDGETTVSLILDSKTQEAATIGGVTAGQVVTNASNALCVTEDGLYLSNIWDCGTFGN